MSSTNRGSDRHVSDYYVTNVPSVVNFLKEFEKVVLLDWSTICILDPCAGGDDNNPMSYPEALQRHFGDGLTPCITTVDIRDDSKAAIIEDYLEHEVDYEPDLIITNPPFALSQPIVEKALSDVKDNGWVVMLLRLNFFESAARKAFFDKFRPVYAFVYSKRLSFTSDNKTDSVAYMHAAWQKGNHPDFTKLKVI